MWRDSGDPIASLAEEVKIYVSLDKPLKAAKRLSSMLKITIRDKHMRGQSLKHLHILQDLFVGLPCQLDQLRCHAVVVQDFPRGYAGRIEQHLCTLAQRISTARLSLDPKALLRFDEIKNELKWCDDTVVAARKLSGDAAEEIPSMMAAVEVRLAQLVRQETKAYLEKNNLKLEEVADGMERALPESSRARVVKRWRAPQCDSEASAVARGLRAGERAAPAPPDVQEQ